MRIKQSISIQILMILILWGCDSGNHLFKKADSGKTGITFENSLKETDDFNIIDYLYFFNGGGVAIGDINRDGLPDIFLSGNQVKNRLYLNKGGLVFEDITDKAGVAGNSTWNTGSVMGDVNGDGLLDIYVCAVVGLKGLTGYNELYVNNGDNTFTEQAAEFGLDFDSFSSSAAFLDYDQDGDLDIYLLNHAVHTQESFGHSDLRNRRSYETGDKLLRNEGNKFTDVSEAAGIYGGINGYGLGIAILDFNKDGFPDIYVGNDFHEDDYFYVNNGDGTFTENVKNSFAQISRFSMGNDVADVNHDGLPDIISLDMLADNELVLKRSEGDERIDILKLRTTRYGYHYQFSRNMLQLNQGNGTFVECALMNGVAATDWSWSALFSDFDQDGNLDLFVSNGIPRRPNDLDYIKFVFSDQIRETIDATKLVDQQALELMPSGKVKNEVFRGKGNGSFENMSAQWLPDELTFSAATAIGDLDSDGDMDVVVNNVNGPVALYENQTGAKSNYLKLAFDYTSANTLGIGTKVYSYHGGLMQYQELYTVRGFQSSSEPIVHFGYGKSTTVDSIEIVWPNGSRQKLRDVATNQFLKMSPQNALQPGRAVGVAQPTLFTRSNGAELNFDFVHEEDRYTDFDRLKLLPYQQSDRGPATAVGDLNGDGKADIFFGGSKRIASKIFIQGNGGFEKFSDPTIRADSLNEDVAAAIFDMNGDGRNDLMVGTGGADFYNRSAPLLDNYYLTTDTGFQKVEIPNFYENASCIKVLDVNKDGYPEVFIGNQSVSNDFGNMPQSSLLLNTRGMLQPVQADLFDQLGMVTDAVVVDYNEDGSDDLVIVGEWMSPTFLKNNNGSFEKDPQLATPLNGLWQSITSFDLDNDGDLDFVLGNWGLNSKFSASGEYPLKMHYSDFDNNGSTETILAIEKEGKYYPTEGLDQLAGQIVSLRKKFVTYKDFAGRTVDEIFSDSELKASKLYAVNELASGFLRNENGTYTFVPFSPELQISPIMALLAHDFDGDGRQEVVLGGNYFGVQPYHGRFGSFSGAVVNSDGQEFLGKNIGLNFFNQSVRDLNVISVAGSNYLLVTVNDGAAQLYKF